MADSDTVILNADARHALSKIAEWRGMPATTNERQMMKRREEVRSYAVEVVNALLRANPELGQ